MKVGLFHYFDQDISHLATPKLFTNPFNYSAHKLCTVAVEELKRHLNSQTQLLEELSQGKMLGVLVVRNIDGEIGYLTAFSGNLNGTNSIEGFVPPIYDMLQPDGFFLQEQQNISAINSHIKLLESSMEYADLKYRSEAYRVEYSQLIAAKKKEYIESKQQRSAIRKSEISEDVLLQITKESQFQKAEVKRLEKRYKNAIGEIESQLNAYESAINILKSERQSRSLELQRAIFDKFQILNYRTERNALCDIFDKAQGKIPPAGAGECSAPKLLQYAYQNGLQPIAMAEFWWGASPRNTLRQDGEFYPACKEKCEPILNFMLQGLNLESASSSLVSIKVLFEDDYLLAVDKPHSVLSVPGKYSAKSVYSILKSQCSELNTLMAVHRLDLSTSGVLLFAKSLDSYRAMQNQFTNREVCKQYIAILDGVVESDEGVIDLPLISDYAERPRQRVDLLHGKKSQTQYRVVERGQYTTRIELYPHTGRTHQLRVHTAHRLGLNAPIVGDMLYGMGGDRLYLHAHRLEFIHPLYLRESIYLLAVEFLKPIR